MFKKRGRSPGSRRRQISSREGRVETIRAPRSRPAVPSSISRCATVRESPPGTRGVRARASRLARRRSRTVPSWHHRRSPKHARGRLAPNLTRSVPPYRPTRAQHVRRGALRRRGPVPRRRDMAHRSHEARQADRRHVRQVFLGRQLHRPPHVHRANRPDRDERALLARLRVVTGRARRRRAAHRRARSVPRRSADAVPRVPGSRVDRVFTAL